MKDYSIKKTIVNAVVLISAISIITISLFYFSSMKSNYLILVLSIITILTSSIIYTKKLLKRVESFESVNRKLEQTNTILEKSSIIIFEWTLEPEVPTKFVTENISHFGYTQEDFYSGDLEDYWNFVYEEDRAAAQETVWRNRENNIDEYKHKYRIICKDGSIRWVEEWTILERDERGNPVSEKGIIRDITQQVEAEERIRHLSFHDPLTGLYNRTYFDEVLNNIDFNEYPVSLIIGDMNELKLANDIYGHHEGDKLLKATAIVFKQACRNHDIIARIGGDEFAVILKNTDEEGVSCVCSRISELFMNLDIKPINPSIALGYATSYGANKKIQALFKEADDNMYENKLNENKCNRYSQVFQCKQFSS